MDFKIEEINQIERFDGKLDKNLVKKALDYALESIDYRLDIYGDQMFPTANSHSGQYKVIDNLSFPPEKNPDNWTTGFWSGQVWLAYQYTQNEKYRRVGKAHTQTFKERMHNYFNGDRKLSELDHHDIGFLYLLSTKADYQLTKDKEALDITLKSADILMQRYLEKAGILQAWGDMSDPAQQGRIIIDCNLNVPLLYFAHKHTGDAKYKVAAENHLKQAVKTLIRADGSTYHTYFFDVETGKPKFGNTHQGYSDSSCWARGQAWGILGFALAYGFNKQAEFLNRSKQLAHYFLNRLPEDLVCNWDLIFTNDDGIRDTSSAAIAAIGLLEISKYDQNPIYKKAALSITKSLIENYMGNDKEGLLKEGVYYYHGNIGITEYLIFGDYYFMELLLRIYQNDKSFWEIEV